MKIKAYEWTENLIKSIGDRKGFQQNPCKAVAPVSFSNLNVVFSVLIHSTMSTWSLTNDGIWHLKIAVFPRITKTSYTWTSKYCLTTGHKKKSKEREKNKIFDFIFVASSKVTLGRDLTELSWLFVIIVRYHNCQVLHWFRLYLHFQ